MLTRHLTRPDFRALALAIVAGLVAATGQAPLDLWFLALPAFCALFWLARRAPDPAQMAWIGWGGGFGYFAAALSWIIEPFLVDVARHGWMAPFAIALLSGGLALLWSLGFWLAARFFDGATLALIVLWSAAEMLRGVLFTGFPWALVGHIWIDTPVRMIAATIGPHGLTLLALLVAGLPFLWRRRWIGGAGALALLVAVFGYGALTLNSVDVRSTGKIVRLLQPNAPQHEKWDPEMISVFFWRQIEMMRAEGAVDLIVWPESALAWRLDRADEALDIMREAAAARPVVFGVNDFAQNAHFNAMGVMGADGTLGAPYHKHHLVPFGEYIPMGEVLGRIGIEKLTAQGGGGFAPGPGPVLIDLPGIGKALPLICYELIFPRHLRAAERPELILQITNDAWFGNLTGPYQHLAQARLRATEQGLPLLRSANTGITAVIDPVGRVLRAVPLNETGYLDGEIPAPLAATLYARTGDWPVLLLILGVLAAFGLRAHAKKD